MKDLTDEFGSTIGKDLPHDLSDPFGTGERKRTAFACCDINERKETADHLGNDCCLCGTGDAHIENTDEKIVQKEVDRGGEKVDRKTDLRLFGCRQKTLENVLENIEGNTEDKREVK